MLVLFESAVGLALFKVKDGKLEDKDIHKQFETEEGANNLLVYSLHNPSQHQSLSRRRQKSFYFFKLPSNSHSTHPELA